MQEDDTHINWLFPDACPNAAFCRNLLDKHLESVAKACDEKLAKAQAEITVRDESLAKAQSMIDALRSQVASLKKMLFGKKSERFVDDPTPLLPGLELPEADEQQAAKTSKVDAHQRSSKQTHSSAGWNDFPEHLPREELIIDLPENEKEGLELIGFETTQRLKHRQEYVVVVVKRAKYAAPGNPGLGVAVPEPLPNVLSENSDRAHYDVSVPIHLIYDKFINHMPFYRQSQDLQRQGIMIGRALMSKWAADIAFLIKPLYQRMLELVMQCPVIHADETQVRMLAKGQCQRCHVWVRKTGIGPPITVFHFTLSRNHATAKLLMGDYLGTCICDGYSGYDLLPGERAGCWAHARRKFFEAQPLDDPRRLEALRLVQLLYDNERKAADAAAKSDAENALTETRKAFRRHSATLAEAYFRLCEETSGAALPPSSPLAKAARYSLNQQKELSVFLANPAVGIDNNPAEQAIRPWALGRKNWLFVGNEAGGETSAIINSLAVTCKENKVDFEAWMADILPRLGKTACQDIDELLPHIWRQSQS